MTLYSLLEQLSKLGGSDLYLNKGAPPMMKHLGKLHAVSQIPLTESDLISIANEAMTPEQQHEFQSTKEMNLAYELDVKTRFRLNIYYQKNAVCMVIRAIKSHIPQHDQLHLPRILTERVMKKKGLILFVGATGVGKSTSQASLLDFRNQHASGHIVTIEDPIEFIHEHKNSLVSQREVGIDTESFSCALKNTLRQAPDVILIGEIRDTETMHHALNFSQTGMLVLSSLHANNATQALERILNFFPEEQHRQVCLDLSMNLDTIVSQRLLRGSDGKIVPAFEVMLNTPLIRELILRKEFSDIKTAMEKSGEPGMQTVDMALFDLCRQGKISEEEAMHYADSGNNLRLRIQLANGFKPQSTDTLETLKIEHPERPQLMDFTIDLFHD